jgi:hypothetical protein
MNKVFKPAISPGTDKISVKAGPLGSQLAIANLKRDSMELGIHKKAQILSNQLSYGLWGLYSSALQAAGLIKGSERRLTDRGVALTDLMLQVFGDSRWQRFEDLAGRNNVTRAQLRLVTVVRLPTAFRPTELQMDSMAKGSRDPLGRSLLSSRDRTVSMKTRSLRRLTPE